MSICKIVLFVVVVVFIVVLVVFVFVVIVLCVDGQLMNLNGELFLVMGFMNFSKGLINVSCIVIFNGMIMLIGIVNIMLMMFVGGVMCGLISGSVSSMLLWMG